MWLWHQHDEPKANRRAVPVDEDHRRSAQERKTRHRGRNLVDWFFILIATAYNLVASERFWGDGMSLSGRVGVMQKSDKNGAFAGR
jgi:hypothetical protein